MISSSDAIGSEQKIRSLFDIKYAFCSIKTNGVLGMDNRKSAYAGRGGGVPALMLLCFLKMGRFSYAW
ncbi:hypothetical protein HEO22_022500 [Escherichia coli]|nr:hypothetical protein [Escherichia coli]